MLSMQSKQTEFDGHPMPGFRAAPVHLHLHVRQLAHELVQNARQAQRGRHHQAHHARTA